MSRSKGPRCPYCGYVLFMGDTECERCGQRVDIPGMLALPEPSTDETLTIYRTADGKRQIFISSRCLEFSSPDIVFKTAWPNLTTIHRGFWGYELYMLKEPDILQASWRSMPRGTWDTPLPPAYPSRRIALDPFGYPDNRELCADLGRHAPQLAPYLPRR